MYPAPTCRSIPGLAAAMSAGPLCAFSPARAADGHGGAPHWGYKGEAGPAKWCELSADFKSCSLGTEQTLIDPAAAIKTQLGSIDIGYQPMALTILNNGHTIQVNTPPGSKVAINGTVYELLQFHFHHPSEHLPAGKGFDMELHFVHKAANGALAVVGVCIKPGTTNAALTPIWSVMPAHETPAKIAEGVTIEPGLLLPADRHYFRYMGSLTTPPCSEGLTRTLFRTPIEASPEQIRSFAGLFPLNARPLQSLNRRFLPGS
jgi:carbonic anhydrase